MKQYHRVISTFNLQWRYTFHIFVGSISILALTEGAFLYFNMRSATYLQETTYWQGGEMSVVNEPWSIRFEEFLARSHVKECFLIALVFTIVLLIGVFSLQRSSSQKEYTISRLPIRRYTWHLISFLHIQLHFIILLAVQFAMILAAYQMYLRMVPKEAQMTQALFLAFFRWDFLRSLFPFGDSLQLIYLVAVLLTLPLWIMYARICIKKKEKILIPLFIYGLAYISFFRVKSVVSFLFSIIVMISATFIAMRIGINVMKEE